MEQQGLSVGEITGIISIGVTILIAVLGGMVWLIKAVNSMNRQVHNNGGSSLKDAIDRIERGQREIKSDVRELRGQHNEINDRLFSSIGKVHNRLDEHIHDHLKGQA